MRAAVHQCRRFIFVRPPVHKRRLQRDQMRATPFLIELYERWIAIFLAFLINAAATGEAEPTGKTKLGHNLK
jgi:hypothetical protein